MKKVAIYARVSTTDKGQSTEVQTLPLIEFVQNRGWQIYNIFEDEVSGAKESRPALNQLMQEARRKRFDVCLVARFDRFARSTKQLLSALETFGALGIDFVSYNENIDTSLPAGKVLFTMIAAFSEMERSLISERVKAGLEKAKANGVTLGRPRANVDIEKVKSLKAQGYSIRKIASTLQIPKSTIQNYL